MKEIVTIIRMNMVGKTKDALAEVGFPSITCKNVLGRGKKRVDFSLIQDYISEEDISNISNKKVIEEVSEIHRLISKRMIVILSRDEDVKKIIEAIIKVNKTGNPGDGKIFISNIIDTIRIRTEETGDAAI